MSLECLMKAEIFAYEKWTHNVDNIQTADLRFKLLFRWFKECFRVMTSLVHRPCTR